MVHCIYTIHMYVRMYVHVHIHVYVIRESMCNMWSLHMYICTSLPGFSLYMYVCIRFVMRP